VQRLTLDKKIPTLSDMPASISASDMEYIKEYVRASLNPLEQLLPWPHKFVLPVDSPIEDEASTYAAVLPNLPQSPHLEGSVVIGKDEIMGDYGIISPPSPPKTNTAEELTPLGPSSHDKNSFLSEDIGWPPMTSPSVIFPKPTKPATW
jgi:hypothetical protein